MRMAPAIVVRRWLVTNGSAFVKDCHLSFDLLVTTNQLIHGIDRVKDRVRALRSW